MGKFGGKGKGGQLGGQQHQASNNSSVCGLDQLNMTDKDINVSGAGFLWCLIDADLISGRVREDDADIEAAAGNLIIYY